MAEHNDGERQTPPNYHQAYLFPSTRINLWVGSRKFDYWYCKIPRLWIARIRSQEWKLGTCEGLQDSARWLSQHDVWRANAVAWLNSRSGVLVLAFVQRSSVRCYDSIRWSEDHNLRASLRHKILILQPYRTVCKDATVYYLLAGLCVCRTSRLRGNIEATSPCRWSVGDRDWRRSSIQCRVGTRE